jgi:Putative restriction endonuclease
MATKTLLTLQDYAALDEPPGVRYELSEGELIVTPASSPLHNRIRDDFNSRGAPAPGTSLKSLSYFLDSRFLSLRF